MKREGSTLLRPAGSPGFLEKFALTSGNALSTFHGQLIQLLLLYYYTDIIGIDPGAVALLFLGTRLFCAVLSPLTGLLFDRMPTTRWGRYKPWFAGATALTGLLGWLVYSVQGSSMPAKLAFATASFLLYSIVMTIGSGPALALGTVMTKRMNDRVSIGQMMLFMVMAGVILAQAGALPLFKLLGGGDDAVGFSRLMFLVALVGVAFALLQARSIRERFAVRTHVDGMRPSIVSMTGSLLRNRPALIVYAITFSTTLFSGIRTMASIYYLKYYFHDESLLAIAGAVAFLPGVLGALLSPRVIRRLDVRATVLLNALFHAVALSVTFLLPATGIGVGAYIALLSLMALSSGLASPAQATMLPAAMDFEEWKTGVGLNSFMGSIQNSISLLSTAFAGAFVAASLKWSGYVPGALNQSATSVLGFRAMNSLIPAAFTLLTLFVLGYDLSERRQTEIARDLAERHVPVEKAVNGIVEVNT
jgi:sugar (glycoside-pentoside-hexuronide) transporter